MLDHRGCVFLSLIIVITGPVTGWAGFMLGVSLKALKSHRLGMGGGQSCLNSAETEYSTTSTKHVDSSRGLSLLLKYEFFFSI